jgi:hypothetical protein
MANYKRKRRHPLRACRLCKFHKYTGNSRQSMKAKYQELRERIEDLEDTLELLTAKQEDDEIIPWEQIFQVKNLGIKRS